MSGGFSLQGSGVNENFGLSRGFIEQSSA